MSPSRNDALFDSSTRPTAPPPISPPIWTEGAYDLTSSIRPRIYGSTETKIERTSICPSAGLGTGDSTSLKSDSFGKPNGLPASKICLFCAIAFASFKGSTTLLKQVFQQHPRVCL